MEKKFTPGPWYASNSGPYQGLVNAESTGQSIAVTYDKRDAELIAAAPDLLRLLDRVLTLYVDDPEHPTSQEARALVSSLNG